MAKGNMSVYTFLNGWLTLQRDSGFVNKLYSYWILGKDAKPKTPRWSIIKDVLHWVDEPKVVKASKNQ